MEDIELLTSRLWLGPVRGRSGRSGRTGPIRGRASIFGPGKAAFIESFRDEFDNTGGPDSRSKNSLFFTNLSRLYHRRYGYDRNFDDDSESPPSPLRDIADEEERMDEQNRRETQREATRTVCPCMQVSDLS